MKEFLFYHFSSMKCHYYFRYLCISLINFFDTSPFHRRRKTGIRKLLHTGPVGRNTRTGKSKHARQGSTANQGQSENIASTIHIESRSEARVKGVERLTQHGYQ